MAKLDAGAGPRFLSDLLQRLALPVSALLAIAGQFLLAARGAAPSRGLVPGLVLYGVAAALALAAALRRPAAESDHRTATYGPDGDGLARFLHRPPPALEWGLVALVVLGGLYLRLHRIDIDPRGLNNDEAINAIEASEIRNGKPFSTVTERGLNRETMFHYLAAFAYRNPGIGLNLLRALPAVFDLQPALVNDELMDRVLPLRAVSILAGTATLLALYLFARAVFNRGVALLGTIFLAVSPWHLLYSRVGLRAILAPLFALAAGALFLRAWRSRRMTDALACGAVLGLGFWTYTSFRAMPIALLAFLLVRRWRAPESLAAPGTGRRALLAGTGLTAAVVLTVLLLSGMGLGFIGRGAYATLPGKGSALVYLKHLGHALTMINFLPASYAVIQSDTFISDGVSAVYGLVGREPETPIVAALATLGLLYGAARAWRGRHAGAAIAVLNVAALFMTVGFLGPSLTRMLPNLPWLCLLAGLFAWEAIAGLAALFWRPVGLAIAGLALGAVVALPAQEGYAQYFLQACRSDKAMQYFWPRQTIMGMFVRAWPSGPVLYVLHSYGRDTLAYLIGDRPDVYMINNPRMLDLDAITKMPRSATFVVEYSEYSRPFAEVLRYLIVKYPDGDMRQIADRRIDPDKTIFYTFSLWKDSSGQRIPPPDEMLAPAGPPQGDAPAFGMPPTAFPPSGAASGVPPGNPTQPR